MNGTYANRFARQRYVDRLRLKAMGGSRRVESFLLLRDNGFDRRADLVAHLPDNRTFFRA
ncbi:hypothetical protein D3C71_1991950 [compost metagenome]